MLGRPRTHRFPFILSGILSPGVLPGALIALAWVPAAGRAAAGPAAVLPPGTAVKGWKQIGAPRLYNSSTLFQLVDGEAEAITAYAFAGCAHGEYAPARSSRPVLTIDVYDMTDPLNAYGLFASDRISGQKVPLGAEGVRIGSSGLNFWKGRYVVRTAIVQVSPATRAAQEAFARAAAARISGASGPPPLVKALPPGFQARSEKYVRANVAGQSFLRNAVSARYPSVGQGAEVFIAQYPSAAAAQSAMAAYRRFERSGTGLAPVPGLGQEAFHVMDRFAKNVVAARKGRYLVGIHHARDATKAHALVAQALARLPA